MRMQSDTGLLTRVDSFPHGRVDHYAPPLHPPPMSNLRSTPFDWGQPPAAAPSQASSVQAAEPDVYTAKRTLTVPVAETGADDRGRAVPSGPDPAAPREATVPSESGATFQNQGSGNCHPWHLGFGASILCAAASLLTNLCALGRT